MADSTVSSTTSASKGIMGLGKGNSTQLNDELISKLKAADESAQINPITKNIDKNKERQEDLKALKTLANNVQSAFSALDNETLYVKRKVNSTGTSASVSAVSGVSLQDLDLDVKQLAQRDSYQSAKFKDQLGIIGVDNSGSFKINIRGVSYQIDVNQSSSLQDIADQINERASGDLQARIVNVGGNNPYQMIIQSKNTGKEQQITFSDDTSGVLKKLGLDSDPIAVLDDKGQPVYNDDGTAKTTSNFEKNRITQAQDAEFTYNGLSVTRSSNTIEDLRSGVTINLKETGKSSFQIVQDTEDIVKAVEDMVQQYNTLVKNLNISTSYDDKTKQSGNFQGVSEITALRSNLNRIFTQQNEKGLSLSDFGLSFSESGELEFSWVDTSTNLTKKDNAKFLSKLANDPDGLKAFFMGTTDIKSASYYAPSSVKSGALKLEAGDLTINGISIKLDETQSTNSAKDNALALANAINNAGIAGIYASLNNDQTGIILKSLDDTDIEIKAKDNATNNFGLSTSTTNSVTTRTSGLFTQLNTTLKAITQDKTGILDVYGTKLSDEQKALDTEKEKIQKSLDTKYSTMRERFVLYSQQITELENQFASLKSMIDFELNGNK
ncbi:flagellar filament capping protein FliD [Campylobacter gastrosuis]|uniref:Flagellar hook-associated protein 2 n=1 Tax=Campylobacter gastrosuis TaxID=2974576 RepID=A0ABT7HNL4_9BACT|nr:flagellar filament capping protein FliD [Campylobacter gastrosuis]MDL0088375.1 flagellar filament capping protein FliD [Campylobacter gastrosuis]